MYLYKYSYDAIYYIDMSNYFDNKKIFDMPIVNQYGSHMVMKESKNGAFRKLYVNFDTRFSNDLSITSGVSGVDLADYNFVLPVRLTNIISMSVTNVEIPISYYNISASFGNNFFIIKNILTGNVYNVVLSDGQYTPTSLQTSINSLLPSDLTFSINSYGQSVFTYTDVSGGEYNFDFYTNTLNGCDVNGCNNPKFKLGWLLGFRYINYSLDGGNTLISECIVNFNGPRYLYLVVDEFQNGKENTFNSLVSSLMFNAEIIDSNCKKSNLCDKNSLITTTPNNKFNSLISSSILKKNILARITPSYKDYPYHSIMPANLLNGALLSDKRAYNRGKIDIQRLNVQLVNEIGQVICLNGGHLAFCLEFCCEVL